MEPDAAPSARSAADRGPDPEARVEEMADELEELIEHIEEARRSAATDPYLEPPADEATDVTEGEQP
jgi:hypothetical protein